MPKLLKTLSILSVVALTGTAFAQDTTKPAAETAPAAEAPADALNMGEAVADPNAPGTPYFRESSGDWQLECLKVEEGQEEPCQLYQALNDADGNQVANVRLFRLPDGGKAVAGALIAVPLETLLTAQLTITVDGGKGKRFPFSVCDRLGCYARIGLTSEDIQGFKKGAKASVTLVPFVAPDQKVELPMSLSGFTAGYDMASQIAAQ